MKDSMISWQASGKAGAVAAGGSGAVAAGIHVLEQGGNAADAAAATLFALTVTDYGWCAIGGEIPLIIYDPALPEKQRGRVVTELVNNIDMAPTFIEMAGAEVPSVYQGRSLASLVQGETVADRREDTFCEHMFNRYNNWHGVRDKRYKYAVYYDDEYECLYDLERDPTERVNLAANPEYAAVRKQLAKRLDEYLAAYPKAQGKTENRRSRN